MHKILLIEDSPFSTRLVENMFMEMQDAYFSTNLISVDRMDKGLGCISIGNIDVVLLDLSLPDAKGFDAFMILKKNAPDMPVVIMSGLADDRVDAGGVGNAQRDGARIRDR